MKKHIAYGLLALAFAPAAADADPGKGKHKAKHFEKHQEKVLKEQRKLGAKRGGRWEEQVGPVEPPGAWHGRDRGTAPVGPLYLPAPSHSHDRDGTRHGYRSYGRPSHGYGPSGYDAGYGRSAYGTYGGYGHGHTHDGDPAYRQSYVVPQAAPHDPHAPHDPGDADAVYTPHGFYETYPQSGYDTYGPRPYGHGRIDPYRFEVYKSD